MDFIFGFLVGDIAVLWAEVDVILHQQKIPFLHPEYQFVVGRDSGCIGTHLVSSKGFHTHPVNL